MFPGMKGMNINPKMMEQAMKKMGMKQEEIPATEVIIKLADKEGKELVIAEPQVTKVNMMGQETYQIVGEAHERERSSEVAITEEDVKTVMEQVKVDKKTAQSALEKSKGDIAEAILTLQENE
ncbi:TPA: nascent polypeptide-associated complex protein [Candidatus Woesearchaeota archaeon]|nr:nascent polypeptide-associated complex protein [Candidatus Woesearchaeota archaeon]HIH47147.1 nascent polypeptide-associated complex protein [Candidatus Woesearchaeota archaeon]